MDTPGAPGGVPVRGAADGPSGSLLCRTARRHRVGIGTGRARPQAHRTRGRRQLTSPAPETNPLLTCLPPSNKTQRPAGGRRVPGPLSVCSRGLRNPAGFFHAVIATMRPMAPAAAASVASSTQRSLKRRWPGHRRASRAAACTVSTWAGLVLGNKSASGRSCERSKLARAIMSSFRRLRVPRATTEPWPRTCTDSTPPGLPHGAIMTEGRPISSPPA